MYGNGGALTVKLCNGYVLVSPKFSVIFWFMVQSSSGAVIVKLLLLYILVSPKFSVIFSLYF